MARRVKLKAAVAASMPSQEQVTQSQVGAVLEAHSTSRGIKTVADLLAHRFRLAVHRLGLLTERPVVLRQDLFRPPSPQGSLF